MIFIFLFPLINSLPYFWGLFEHIPSAPVALIVFYFFLMGLTLNMTFSKRSPIKKSHVYVPILAFSCLILISGIITFFRYANFYPFLSDSIYELLTNVNGVTSGGAIMSSLFSGLNYLTGFAFFIILLNVVSSRRILDRILTALGASTLLTLFFGLYQRYFDYSAGNTPFWIELGQINSTFKDPNSFAAFIASVWPLFLVLFFVWKGKKRVLPGSVLVLALLVFPLIGNRSSLLGFTISILALACFAVVVYLKRIKTSPGTRQSSSKILLGFTAAAVCILCSVGVFTITRSQLVARLKGDIKNALAGGGFITLTPERYFLWKEAVRMTKDYPLTGVGLGAYIIELPNYLHEDKRVYENQLGEFRRDDSAENYLLQVSAELGLMGLACVVWIFVTIFSRMIKTLKGAVFDRKNAFIVVGAMAGILAFMVNFLFHSFIGSFEIKYTFWLLVGLIFAWERIKGGKEKEKVFINRNVTIIGLVLIMIFGGVHLWNSTHSLSLKNRTEKFELKQDFGLYDLEKTSDGREFRWTKKNAGVTLKVEKPVISIPVHAAHPDISEKPVKVRIYVVKDFFKKKRLLDEIVLSRNIWENYKYSLPDEAGQDIILLFKVNRTWNPMETLGAPDPRNLGIALGQVIMQEKLEMQGGL